MLQGDILTATQHQIGLESKAEGKGKGQGGCGNDEVDVMASDHNPVRTVTELPRKAGECLLYCWRDII